MTIAHTVKRTHVATYLLLDSRACVGWVRRTASGQWEVRATEAGGAWAVFGTYDTRDLAEHRLSELTGRTL